jgi:hypothetical protein
MLRSIEESTYRYILPSQTDGVIVIRIEPHHPTMIERDRFNEIVFGWLFVSTRF